MEPSEPTPNPPSPSSGQLPEHRGFFDRELLIFLREENEAARSALREESKANRDVLLGALKIVAYPLAVLVAIAGFLGWRSLADLKTTIQNEAHQETTLEIKRMQTEIRTRLDTQFQTPELRKVVREAAREQTGVALHPLIVKEVSTDVARSVTQEQETIKSAVVVEVHKAVNDLSPTLDGIVHTRVNNTVDGAVDAKIAKEVAPVLQSLQANERVSNLILNAQGDDGASFDQLVRLAFDQSASAQQRDSVLAIVRAIAQRHNDPFYASRTFIEKKSDDEMLQLLHDPDLNTRKAALDNISLATLKANMPQFMQVMTNDSNLNVREAAFRRFDQIRNDTDPKHHIDYLDNGPAWQWWITHQSDFEPKPK